MSFINKFVTSVTSALEINSATLSGAIDIIVVKQADGTMVSTPVHVRFGKLQLLHSREKAVTVAVNGKTVDWKMKLGSAGEAFFVLPSDREEPIGRQWITSPLTSPTLSPTHTEALKQAASDPAIMDSLDLDSDTEALLASTQAAQVPDAGLDANASSAMPIRNGSPIQRYQKRPRPWTQMPPPELGTRTTADPVASAQGNMPGSPNAPASMRKPHNSGISKAHNPLPLVLSPLLSPTTDDEIGGTVRRAFSTEDIPAGRRGTQPNDRKSSAATTHRDATSLSAGGSVGSDVDSAGRQEHEADVNDGMWMWEWGGLPIELPAPAMPSHAGDVSASASGGDMLATAFRERQNPSNRFTLEDPEALADSSSQHITTNSTEAHLDQMPAVQRDGVSAAAQSEVSGWSLQSIFHMFKGRREDIPHDDATLQQRSRRRRRNHKSKDGRVSPTTFQETDGRVVSAAGVVEHIDSSDNRDRDSADLGGVAQLDHRGMTSPGRGQTEAGDEADVEEVDSGTDDEFFPSGATPPRTNDDIKTVPRPLTLPASATAKPSALGSGFASPRIVSITPGAPVTASTLNTQNSPAHSAPDGARAWTRGRVESNRRPASRSIGSVFDLLSPLSPRFQSPRADSDYSGETVSMSLCASLIAANPTFEEAEHIFDAHVVSYTELCNDPSLIYSHELVFRYQNRIYPAHVALPLMLSQVVFGQPLTLSNSVLRGLQLPPHCSPAQAVAHRDSIPLESADMQQSKTPVDAFTSHAPSSVPQLPVLESSRGSSVSSSSTGRLLQSQRQSAASSGPKTPSGDAAQRPGGGWFSWFRSSPAKQRSLPSEVQTQTKVASTVTSSTVGAVTDVDIAVVTKTEVAVHARVQHSADTAQHEEEKSTPKYKKALRPTQQMLESLDLRPGRNEISFSVTSGMQGTQVISAFIYLWPADSRIVVSDIDGTITRSDVLGLMMPLVGQDWSHPGVATLYSNIVRNGYKILYLTSRAIGQASITRCYIESLRQGGYALPDGPVIMSPDRLIQSFKREVVYRRPQDFKIVALGDVRRLFSADKNCFYAGFGNRPSDVIAYRAVGIPASKVFIINRQGEISQVNQGYSKSYPLLNDMVDNMFPATDATALVDEEFNAHKFWRTNIIDADSDLSDLSSRSSDNEDAEDGVDFTDDS